MLLGLGLVGVALVAALVVTLAGAWGLSEVLGWRHSLNDSPRRAAGFYGLAAAGMLGGAVLVLVAPSLIALSVQVGVMDACLLPVVLGFLLILEHRALPVALRQRGLRRAVTYVLTGAGDRLRALHRPHHAGTLTSLDRNAVRPGHRLGQLPVEFACRGCSPGIRRCVTDRPRHTRPAFGCETAAGCGGVGSTDCLRKRAADCAT